MNGILQLQLFVVTLLEERLPADEVLANRSRFPREIRTLKWGKRIRNNLRGSTSIVSTILIIYQSFAYRWIALKEVRSFVVPTNEKHRDAERSNAALLRVFLSVEIQQFHLNPFPFPDTNSGAEVQSLPSFCAAWKIMHKLPHF